MGPTSIIFTGDIGFDKYMTGKWADEALLSPEILTFLQSADHVAANVEGALMTPQDGAGQFCHTMDPGAVQFLQTIGADLWCIGNNHIMDAGLPGLQNTQMLAEQKGCRTFGAGEDLSQASAPVYLPEAGGIGLVSVSYEPDCPPAGKHTPGTLSWDDFDTIKTVIGEIKQKCRWCIVVAHGGEEFADLPMPYVRQRYHRYLALGADIVVGHHPHVVENYEYVGDKAIFYSLGNFVFDTDYQRAQLYTDRGVLLRMTFSEESFSFDALGMQLDRTAGRLSAGSVPAVFTEVDARAYDALLPLAARAFLAAEQRRMRYLEPEKYTGAGEGVWNAYFSDPHREDYVPGAHMEFGVICPLAAQEAAVDTGKTAVEQYLSARLEEI